ncbi:hypothetical protein [Pseudomonas viridiflava]|uniref:hypothetical protein n=1 Tax=Pseudomonas viridiflava TaxID=33069 RepID=UPI000F010E2B|nr:hypothetical protein [Pseudomonas viridiflava]
MDLSTIKIVEYTQQRIWLVRGEQGKLFGHFREHSVVSIGHLDQFYDHRVDGATTIPSDEDIRQLILKDPKFRDKHSKSPKLTGGGTKHYNQILHFLRDIKKGDIILTVNDNYVMFGVCTSSTAFLRARPLKIKNSEGKYSRVELDHRLRRSVSWGPEVRRSAIGGDLKRAFQSRQTVVKLSDHWKDVLGLIYPFVYDGKSVYFSTHIGRPTEISGKIVGKLFDNLADVQVIFDEILKGRLTDDFVNDLLEDKLPWSTYKLTTKAQFMSPGDIYSSVSIPSFVSPVLALKIVALIFLINSGVVEAAEVEAQLSDGKAGLHLYLPDGLLDERSVQRGGSKNLDRMLGQFAEANKAELEKIQKRKKVSQVKKHLRVSIPEHDTSDLEDQSGLKIRTVKGNAD